MSKAQQTGKTKKVMPRKRKLMDEAAYENEVQFMCAFSDLLDKHIQDIGIEDSGAPYQGSCYIEWGKVRCRKCYMCYTTSESFLDHILVCQFTKKEQDWYKKYEVVTKEVQAVIDEALDERATNSYIAKPMMNTTDIRCTIPIKSPLAPYIWRGMAIYYEKAPSDLRKVVVGVLQKPKSKKHRLYFSARLIERQIDEVVKTKEDNLQKKMTRELRKVCPKCYLNFDDIILNEKSRSRSDTRDLALALGFGNEKVTQDQIMERVRVMFPAVQRKTVVSTTRGNSQNKKKTEEIIILPPNKAKSVDRLLTSAFTSHYLKPLAAKRQSTFRTPTNA